METKICKQCNNSLEVKDFRGKVCKICFNLEWRNKYKTNKEFSENLKQKSINYLRQKRKEALQVYGGKCACCGESTFEFLTFDHINGRTKEEKYRKGDNSYKFLKWLSDNNYPSTIQVLCYNCNCAKGHYKKCPHQSQELVGNEQALFSVAAK